MGYWHDRADALFTQNLELGKIVDGLRERLTRAQAAIPSTDQEHVDTQQIHRLEATRLRHVEEIARLVAANDRLHLNLNASIAERKAMLATIKSLTARADALRSIVTFIKDLDLLE